MVRDMGDDARLDPVPDCDAEDELMPGAIGYVALATLCGCVFLWMGWLWSIA
jgi:hypothetical protein